MTHQSVGSARLAEGDDKERPVRIAFCIFKYFPHGGIQRDLLKICRECLARGVHVRIYTTQWRGELAFDSLNKQFETPPALEICTTPARALSRHRLYERFAERVRRDLLARPVDLVVGMNKMPGLDVHYAGDSCYQEKARTQRHVLYRLLPRYRSLLRAEQAVFDPNGHTEILTIAATQPRVFQRCYGTPQARFHPLPPGIERDRAAPPNRQAERSRLRRALGLAASERLLLFVGSGFIKKGLGRALKGLDALPGQLLNRTRLFVLGDDNSERFERMARLLALGDRVRFLGGRDDVSEFMLAADGLVLPALDETAGMVILEAMIAGLPVLATENCGYANYLQDARAGLITPTPFLQRTFNAQLVEFLTSQERERWSKNGMALAKDETIHHMVPTAVELLEKFAKTPRRLSNTPAQAGSNRVERPAIAEPTAVATQFFMRQDFEGPHSAAPLFVWAETVEGLLYRRVRGRLTQRVTSGDNAYFLKSHSGVGWLEILKNAVTGKRPVLGAENEFRACQHLERCAIPAPRVAAFADTGGNPAARRSLILCDELTGFVSLESIVDQWDETPPNPAQLRRLVKGVAQFVRRLHTAGVVHRDLYICHLCLHTGDWAAGEVRLAVLDLHRARILNPMPDYWRKRDLAALLFSTLDAPLHRRAWLRFVRVYSGRPLRQAFATNGAFWQSVHRRAMRLYGKGMKKGLVKGHFARANADAD